MSDTTLQYLTKEQIDQDVYDVKTKFTTGDDNHVGDEYFLSSGDKIRYFLEEEAVDKDGKLTREKHLAVNKIGHGASLPFADAYAIWVVYLIQKENEGLHELDPVFRAVTLENPSMRAVARDLRFHHDPYTNPPSALGFWIPLEKCTPENGALSFLPGSHRATTITKRFVRLPGGGTGFEELIPPEQAPPKPEGKYVLEACMPGDLVLIHGSVLHKSPKNTSLRTRFAYTFHMIETPPYAVYDEKNWLQPTAETPFPKLLDTPNSIVLEPTRV
ncbi:hypothetical protein PHLCEN_2v324 [Hermanssonia centrifuga]|uniref:Phytanoyl-CoA dioxygenase n=1 Tax=Hermanssonia centrifuga TaxID=98765 RepID=A0A2R6S6G6_9APHY|nr:hypothetical protein PHLCEN_2v324 [Hermanssonia centrifuga]